MMLRVANIFFVLALLSAIGCGSSGSASKSGNRGEYSEDLSAYRPDYTKAMDSIESPTDAIDPEGVNLSVIPEYDDTDEVNTILDSISYLKKNINYVDGFTVQVYTGINREQANAARAEVYSILPDGKPEILYNQPNFKVKVGQFYTRREANKTFTVLKRAFPAAIVIPERIPVQE